MIENKQLIEDIINNILDDDEVSDSALMQYCLDTIESMFPYKYSDEKKYSIIWDVFQSRNTEPDD